MDESGSKSQKQGQCSTIIGILVVVSTVCVSAHGSLPKLSLHRATSSSLIISVEYDLSNLKWALEYKQNSLYAEDKWEEWKELHPSIDKNITTFYLRKLTRRTEYYIRLRVEPGELVSEILEAKTCSSEVPPIRDQRVKDYGPGWIDVLWTPPVDDCRSQLEYWVMYRAESNAPTHLLSFGYTEKSNPYAVPRPHHPCPEFPREFCVLLTDEVVAGKRHIIDVAVHRFNATNYEYSTWTSIRVFVNSKNYARENPETCELSYFKEPKIDNTHQIDLPLWVAVMLGVGFIVALGGMILGYYLLRKKKIVSGNISSQPRCVEEYELPEYEELQLT